MVRETIKNFVRRLVPASARGPQRLGPDRHGIDRRKVSRHAIKVCEVLQHEGYQAYIVGGAVRDLIVGLEPKDFDVSTNATPEQVRPLFRRARIIGRRFQLVHVVFGREIIETSTFRAPSADTEDTDEHGRILRDNLFGTHEQDAARRDFTLNALYYDPMKDEVIDFHGGVADLRNRIVRMIGDPRTRYREDPVRMLRAVRFASKLNATIDPASREPIADMAGLIENVPESRIFDEVLKLLTCGHALACVECLRAVGLHQGLLPLIDLIYEEAGGEQFITLALERTDARVRAGKTASPSFLFAALLWPMVNKRWQGLVSEGVPRIPALMQAADSVIEEQTRKLAIQRRFQADMKEIWFMQPRFERATPKSIWRMLDQPRFRAAVDFLQLRAATREVDSVQAQWWMDLADAEDGDRTRMIESYNRPADTSGGTPRRRRRPRRRGARKQAEAQGSTGTDGRSE